MKHHRNGKSVSYYMHLPYAYEVTPDSSGVGFVISIKELPGCLSQGDTIMEAMARMREVMEGWFFICIEDGLAIPEPGENDKYSGRFVVRIPKNIHRAVAKAAGRSGTSINMFVATTLAQAVGAAR